MKQMVLSLFMFLFFTNCTDTVVNIPEQDYEEIKNGNSIEGGDGQENEFDVDFDKKYPLNLDPVKDGETRNIVVDYVWPENHGDAAVCLWKDDKTAAFSISIDDNQENDIDFWIQKQDEYGFPVTWFLITECGTWPGWDRTANAYSYNVQDWNKFRTLAERGNYVDGHDDRNWYNNPEDLKGLENPDSLKYVTRLKSTRVRINTELKGTGNRALTYAYPFGDAQIDYARTQYIAFRGTNGILNNANNVNYLNVNSVSSNHFYANPAKYIEPLLDETKALYNVKYFRGWGSTHFHGLGNAAAQVDNMFKYLKEREDKLWISGFTPIAQYGQERDTHTLTVTSKEEKQIKLTLTHKMNPEVFDFPLTVKVRVDNKWYDASARQGEKELEVKLVNHEGNKYLLLDVAPNKEEVVIDGVLDNDPPVFNPIENPLLAVGEEKSIEFSAKTNAGDELKFTYPVLPSFAKAEDLGNNSGKLTFKPGIFDVGEHQVVILADNGRSQSSLKMTVKVNMGENVRFVLADKNDAAVYYPTLNFVDPNNRTDIIVGGSYKADTNPMSAIFPFAIPEIPAEKMIEKVDFMVNLITNSASTYNVNLYAISGTRDRSVVLHTDGYAGDFNAADVNGIKLQENFVTKDTKAGFLMSESEGLTDLINGNLSNQGKFVFLRLSPSQTNINKFARTTFTTADGAGENQMLCPKLVIYLKDK